MAIIPKASSRYSGEKPCKPTRFPIILLQRARKAAFGLTPVSPAPTYLTDHLPRYRSHRCPLCGFSYSYESGLKMHITTHRPAPPNPMVEMEFINPTLLPGRRAECTEPPTQQPPFIPLLVIGPMWFEPWLVEYSRVEQLEYIFVDGAELTKTTEHIAAEFFERQLGISKITAQIVIHSFPTYAVVLEHRDGWKFVYSGDTRPCPPFIEVSLFFCTTTANLILSLARTRLSSYMRRHSRKTCSRKHSTTGTAQS